MQLRRLAFFALCALLLCLGVLACQAAPEDLYATLGVTKTATKAEIRSAFRAITRRDHPDLKDSFDEKETAKAQMVKVLRAYSVLTDDTKRQDYDDLGVIDGEAPDPNDFDTVNALFEKYHERSPIFSKTTTISTELLMDRILHFRGARLFLIEVYNDNCGGCRTFSNAWETLYHSGLVQAGILEMYRIEYKTADGDALVKKLGLRIPRLDNPYVFAIIDGEQWKMHGLDEQIKGKNERRTFQHALDFVMNFFYEMYTMTTTLEAITANDVVKYLEAPRTLSQPVRVLFPKINAESVPVAVEMRYGAQVQVRSIDRQVLLSFVEDYCDMEVDVKDRRGESVPMPEFIVVSTEALPAFKDVVDSDAELEAEPRSCRNVHIGASVVITYDKASDFVKSMLPPRHSGMGALPLADSMGFYDVCRENCVLWVRPNCDDEVGADEKAMVALMTKYYGKFQTGYLCLNEHAGLKPALSPAKANAVGPNLVAFADGDDHRVYQLTALSAKLPSGIEQGDIENLLSEILDRTYSGSIYRSEAPLSSLFTSEGFPMTSKQRWYLIGTNTFNLVRPFAGSTLPFVVMYFVHTKFFRKKQDAEDEKKKKEEEERRQGATTTNPPPRAPDPVGPLITAFSEKDVAAAKVNKGFLILIRDDRKAGSGPLKLPTITLDTRFTVRSLDKTDKAWTEWIAAHASHGGDVVVIAVRKQRLRAAVKPAAEDLDTFLRDLLEGAKATDIDPPSMFA